jgi:type IV secretory pathway TraG/TraD family ATPase VirD4
MVIGSTGRGKTVALLNIVESCTQRELPIIFVDGKWDSDLPEKMRKLAEQNDRAFYHFDMRGILSKTCYNPLQIGDSDNVKEKLIDITDWSEEHYKANSERVLMLIVRVIEQLMKETVGLSQAEIDEKISIDRSQKSFLLRKDVICIQRMLIPDMLDRCINAIDDDDIRRDCHDIFERMEHSWYAGLESRLALLAESNLRKLVKETNEGINLIDAMDEGAVVLFSLDALRNNSATKLLGRLIVKDVNTAISIRNKGDTVYSIYDEHGAYISEDIDALFAMARSYGLHVITSTQNAADYKKSRLGDVLMRKVFGNTNLKLVLMQNEASDADYLSSTVGTEKTTNRTISTDDNNEYKGSGMKDVEEFILHPNKIKDLGIGEGYLIRKIPKQSVSFVKIKMIDFEKIGKDKEIDLEKNEVEKEFDLEIKKENKLDFKKNIKSYKMVKMEKGIKRDPLERRKRNKLDR